MPLTPEQEIQFAEFLADPEKGALFREALEMINSGDAPYIPRRPPPPKVVVSNDRLIRDADVPVSPKDPNAPFAQDGVVRVRRDEPAWSRRVTVNEALADAQWHQRQAEAQRGAALAEADPMNVWRTRSDD